MSHDDAGGEISLDARGKNVSIKWEKVGNQENFSQVNEMLKKITTTLDGKYIMNPMWSHKVGKSLITVHPLGGCSMGENGELGVVNHKGQVYVGK